MAFVKGQSGNPAGKVRGTKNRKTIIMAELSRDGSALAITIKERALAGDPTCLGLWINRLEPALKARAEKVQFERDRTKPLYEQAQDILDAIARGEVDPETGSMLIASIDKAGNLRAVDELAQRLAALEARTL